MDKKTVIVRGGGDLATGVIYVLFKAGFKVISLETEMPSAIRRTASFCEAVYEGSYEIEGIKCVLCSDVNEALSENEKGNVAMLNDKACDILEHIRPYALVDAILAKKNLGTNRDMADIVIALGPGFEAGRDADIVIETMRGHNLGRMYETGSAIPNTGVPGLIAGHSSDRVIHAEHKGILYNRAAIGDVVKEGDTIAVIRDERGMEHPVRATFTGLLRGLIRDGYPVTAGFKIADIDARTEEHDNCFTISDKARSLGGSVLCAIMYLANKKTINREEE